MLTVTVNYNHEYVELHSDGSSYQATMRPIRLPCKSPTQLLGILEELLTLLDPTNVTLQRIHKHDTKPQIVGEW